MEKIQFSHIEHAVHFSFLSSRWIWEVSILDEQLCSSFDPSLAHSNFRSLVFVSSIAQILLSVLELQVAP
jgi:hypothetical protein